LLGAAAEPPRYAKPFHSMASHYERTD